LNREQLQNNASKEQFYLRVEMEDLMNFDEQLASSLRNYPAEFIPIVSDKNAIIRIIIV
jgi:DNA replicative helicase MCM subunit Mcm2 (Cdc46/Mcm family)